MGDPPKIDILGKLEVSLLEKNEMLIRDCDTKILELVLKLPTEKYAPLFIFQEVS